MSQRRQQSDRFDETVGENVSHAIRGSRDNSRHSRDTAEPPSYDAISRQHSNSSALVPPEPQHHTLTIWNATFLVCGELAGVGVLSIPRAFANAGWIGVPIVAIIGLIACYAGFLLSKSWILLQEMYIEYRTEYCRYPYPAIGERTIGIWGRRVISTFVNLTSFGTGVVFVVVAAQNVQTFVNNIFHVDLTLCWYLLIVGAVFVPVTWLESPKDFWVLGMGAYLATFTMLVLVIVGSLIVYFGKGYTKPVYDAPTFGSFFQSFGTYMFAYGVHPFLLGMQSDMHKQHEFRYSILYGFLITISSYLPAPIIAYFVFGSVVNANVLIGLPAGIIQYIGLVLVTAHVLLASNIVWNTLYQEAEHLFRVTARGFSVRRLLVRSGVMALGVFCALTLPNFGPLLDLVGGFAVTSLIFIFPPLCYYLLCRQAMVVIQLDEAFVDGARTSQAAVINRHVIPMWEKFLLFELIGIGILGMVASTYFSLYELLKPGTFYAPCYVNWWYLTANHK